MASERSKILVLWMATSKTQNIGDGCGDEEAFESRCCSTCSLPARGRIQRDTISASVPFLRTELLELSISCEEAIKYCERALPDCWQHRCWRIGDAVLAYSQAICGGVAKSGESEINSSDCQTNLQCTLAQVQKPERCSLIAAWRFRRHLSSALLGYSPFHHEYEPALDIAANLLCNGSIHDATARNYTARYDLAVVSKV